MRTMSRIRARRWLLAGALTGAMMSLGFAQTSHAQGQGPAMTAQERADAQVVRNWFAAWQTHDPQKVASYMAPDVEFRAVPERPISRGRAAFIKSEGGLVRSATTRVTEVLAIGGAEGTGVMIKRIDTIMINGKTLMLPFAAFFRVEHGLIQEWLDLPLVARPAGAGPNALAPAGPGPAGN